MIDFPADGLKMDLIEFSHPEHSSAAGFRYPNHIGALQHNETRRTCEKRNQAVDR